MERYMDTSLSPEERADDLFAKLSREEIVAQLQNYEIGIDAARCCDFESEYGIGFLSAEWMQECADVKEAIRLQRELQARAMEQSPHHIPSIFYIHGLAGAHVPRATSFPSDLNRGANFNTRLEELIGSIIARQSLVMGINYVISPIMDITRDFFVERKRKTYSEARTLGVIMGGAYTKGIRSVDIDGRRVDVISDLNVFRVDMLPEDRIDHMAWTVIKEKFRMGLFEHPFAMDEDAVEKALEHKANYEIARIGAEESLILLKNNGIIPLDHNVKKVVVIGPHAQDSSSYYLTEQAAHRETQTIFDCLKNEKPAVEIVYARGYDYYGDDESGYEEALALLADADIAILTLGMRYNYWNHEIGGLDITTNCGIIPPCQEKLIARISEMGIPMVGIHLGVHPFANHLGEEKLDAILEALLPGEATADAVVDVLSGKVNPCGRLPIEVYDNQLQTLRRAFGYGMSFSNFEYRDMSVDRNEVSATENFEIRVHLENHGPIAGSELIQLYRQEDKAVRENRKLMGLRKVFFLSGESHDVVFTIDPAQMAIPSEDGAWMVQPGQYTFMIGRSVNDIIGEVSVTIHGTDKIEGPERVFYSTSRVE